jgi:DNA-binding transcriptional LysR family regulator
MLHQSRRYGCRRLACWEMADPSKHDAFERTCKFACARRRPGFEDASHGQSVHGVVKTVGCVCGAWPQHQVVPILEDVDTLIMSPEALFARKPIYKPADVEGHLLLSSETRPGDWLDWLQVAGLSHLSSHPRQVFDHFFVTRQAVEDGLGLGIGPLPMLAIDIASRRLMVPLPEIRVRRTGYIALLQRHEGKAAVVTAFIGWLAAEGESVPGQTHQDVSIL